MGSVRGTGHPTKMPQIFAPRQDRPRHRFRLSDGGSRQRAESSRSTRLTTMALDLFLPAIGWHVTLPDQMPSKHRRHADCISAGVVAQAMKLGSSDAAFCELVMADRPHPEQGFRTCRGNLALAKSYDAICPNSVRWPRSALIACVLCRIRISLTRETFAAP